MISSIDGISNKRVEWKSSAMRRTRINVRQRTKSIFDCLSEERAVIVQVKQR